jgi:mono/diheme cytochrome c family protein
MRRRAAFLAFLAALVAGCGSGEEVRPLPEGVEGTVPTQTAETETEAAEEPAGEGDPAAGKDVFAEAGCGTCHTLADAGTTGTIGPSLDESQPSFELAVERVTNGMGAMPPFRDQLSEQQIQDVAAYVSQAAGG